MKINFFWIFLVVIKYWRNILLITLVSFPAIAEETKENTAVSINMLGPALHSSDIERSTKYYKNGLGMTLATTLKHGTVTEAIFSFEPPNEGKPVIMVFKDEASDKSQSIESGNSFGHIVLSTSNITALAAKLVAAGYSVGEIHENLANHMKVMMIEDPDGYKLEIVEREAPKH